MTTPIKPIPDGYHSLTPYLIVRGAAEALAFYQKAFGATDVCRLDAPDGTVAHAEMKIGDSIIMVSEENPAWGSTSPQALGGSPVTLFLYVNDVDATFADAIKAGATEKRPVTNQFWGDRSGHLVDPFGHYWHIATHIEDVDPSELPSRMAACFPAHQE